MVNKKWQWHVWFLDGGIMHKLKSNMGVLRGTFGNKVIWGFFFSVARK